MIRCGLLFLFAVILCDKCSAQSGTTLQDITNAYRTSNGQSSIPISLALQSVAQIHANLLAAENLRVDCSQSLHSWPDYQDKSRQTWTSCCYLERSSTECIWKKPRQITTNWPIRYEGEGTELVVAIDGPVDSTTEEKVLGAWKVVESINDKILNLRDFTNVTWRAFGAGVAYNQRSNKVYASVWLGTLTDRNEFIPGFAAQIASNPALTPHQPEPVDVPSPVKEPVGNPVQEPAPQWSPGDGATIPSKTSGTANSDSLPDVKYQPTSTGDTRDHNSNILIICFSVVGTILAAAIITLGVVIYRTRKQVALEDRSMPSPPRIDDSPIVISSESLQSQTPLRKNAASPSPHIPYSPARLAPPAIHTTSPPPKTPAFKITSSKNRTPMSRPRISTTMTPSSIAAKVVQTLTPGPKTTPYHKLKNDSQQSEEVQTLGEDIEMNTVEKKKKGEKESRFPIPFPSTDDFNSSEEDDS